MKTWKRSAAFTLVELLVVIMIIAILAGLLLGALSGMFSTVDVGQAESTVKNMYVAIEQFKLENSKYPDAQTPPHITDDTGGILEEDGSNSIADYFAFDRQFFIDYGGGDSFDTLVDPWNQPYVYVDASSSGNIQTELGAHPIAIFSAGQNNYNASAPYYTEWQADGAGLVLPIYKEKGK